MANTSAFQCLCVWVSQLVFCIPVIFQNPISVIYCRSKDGTLSKHEAGINLSNGIAVQHSADGTPMLLIVAETFSKRLWSFDILGAGKLGNKRFGEQCQVRKYV